MNSQSTPSNPITARFLSPDPFVQNPASSQDYNRYTYVNNNPLRFTDPSGYMAHGSGHNPYWAQAVKYITQMHEEWNNVLDKSYNRGMWAAQGGGGGYFGAFSSFGGMVTFYFKNGKLYTIADNGTVITTNKKDKDTRAFYKNGQYGFYAQTSGTATFSTINGNTVGASYSDAVCQWVPVGGELPAWNDVGWVHYGENNNYYKSNEINSGTDNFHSVLYNTLPHCNILSAGNREAVTGLSASFAVASVAALPEPHIALGLGVVSFGLQSLAYADVVFDYASNPNPSPSDDFNFWASTITFGVGIVGVKFPKIGLAGSGFDTISYW